MNVRALARTAMGRRLLRAHLLRGRAEIIGGVNDSPWDALTSDEQAFLINSYEIDILPGVWGDLEEPLLSAPPGALAEVLLRLVDRGWIAVCEVEPWTAPDGRAGFQPGPPLPRESLPELLADPLAWEYPEDDWIGALTLVETDAGRKITRKGAGEG
ncbi:hypothetical protein [Streptomyces netropsis]|uniref:Uncharacterized protein n=1 Tax=Streptomyces netropsis TaxID=55404 RepID=A0A7W7L6F6_STRNE|nr:hypothetical protein [Streptomyces netropsis]MBB4884500.1 hypothetical protein [Streptomyces netropsis]GGR03228.1 hypothetical protein GCM10010219_04110 [Streptomyces netropsis]